MDNIKHDKRFLNSTVTHSETESEAIGKAQKKLAYVVKKYVGDNTDLKFDGNVIGLEGKEERLVVLEEGVYYVLIYVPKSVVLEFVGVQSPTNEEEIERQYMESDPISSTTIEKSSTLGRSNISIEGASELAEWQKKAIGELLSCGNSNATIKKLQQMKDYFKVKLWGVGSSCPDAAKAYWIVFDDNQNLVTILGPGTDKRRDFHSNNFSSLDNYKNMNAIWFYLAK